MAKKYLAYISPIENITGKEYAYCNVTFITGDLDHRTFSNIYLKTDIFKYYYYGSALEVVELGDKQEILNIHDLTIEEAREFGVSLYNILTLNRSSFDMLASNDFTYNLKVNKFYNYCRQTVENMFMIMQHISGFALRVYIINGAVIYIELDENPKKNSQYILESGYVVSDKSKLRHSLYMENVSNHGNEKLKQEDIDKLVTKFIG